MAVIEFKDTGQVRATSRTEFRTEIAIACTFHLPDARTRPSRSPTSLNRREPVVRPTLESTERRNCPVSAESDARRIRR